jgi:hypothetical protein
MTDITTYAAGWMHAGVPVHVGALPPSLYTLDALAKPEQIARLVPAMAGLTGGPRQATLSVLHYAVFAVTSLLIAPLLVDEVELVAAADQIGVVLDEQAYLSALWIGAYSQVRDAPSSTRVVTRAVDLLAPVSTTVRLAGRVSAHGAADILFDALIAGSRFVARTAGVDASSVIAALLDASPSGYAPALPLHVRPDAGPTVILHVPRTCCVLSKEPGPHACPTCPQYPSDAVRVQHATAWLQSLDDADFRDATGRARV